ncbi:hypothetical protein ACWC6I_41520 [Streptomyces sp. NPDC001414]
MAADIAFVAVRKDMPTIEKARPTNPKRTAEDVEIFCPSPSAISTREFIILLSGRAVYLAKSYRVSE